MNYINVLNALALIVTCTVGAASAQAIAPPTTGSAAGEKAVVTFFVEDSVGDVQVGRLALARSKNAAVRMLAANMVRDHTQTAHAGLRVAAQIGSAVEFKAGDDNQITLSHLSLYSRAQFDREFSTAMVQAHKSDIATAKDALEFAKTPALRKYLQDAIAVDTRHLNMALAAKAQVVGEAE